MSARQPGLQHVALLPRPRTAALLLAGTAALALLSFWYRYLDVLTRGGVEPFQVKLIEEFTGTFGAALLLVPVVWLTRTLHVRRTTWPQALLIHVPALVAFAVLHTAMLWASRSVLFPLAGLGAYDYGAMPLRFLMELGIQIPIYIVAVAGTLAFEHRRASRERDLRMARIEAELANARLLNLEHQLRPHFLFNALNTISSVMYEDLDRADRILNDLARLLRQSLRTSDAGVVALGDEIRTLELFLGIARARFEERLDARITVEDMALAAAVPALLLQPLVENALQHGDPGDDAVAIIRIAVRVRDDRLHLCVTDNGPGMADGDARRKVRGVAVAAGSGIGLANTRRRLELLYPGRHGFSYGAGPEGGFEVRIEIPLERMPGYEPAHASTVA